MTIGGREDGGKEETAVVWPLRIYLKKPPSHVSSRVSNHSGFSRMSKKSSLIPPVLHPPFFQSKKQILGINTTDY